MRASATGSVDEEMVPRTEYLATQHPIIHEQIQGRLKLTDDDARVVWFANRMLFGEASACRALHSRVEHFHAKSNHQGRDNVLRFPDE